MGRPAGLLYFSNFLVHLQETVVGVLLSGWVLLNTYISECPLCFRVYLAVYEEGGRRGNEHFGCGHTRILENLRKYGIATHFFRK